MRSLKQITTDPKVLTGENPYINQEKHPVCKSPICDIIEKYGKPQIIKEDPSWMPNNFRMGIYYFSSPSINYNMLTEEEIVHYYKDFINQWEVVSLVPLKGVSECLCTHRISNLYYIRNTINDNVLLVGSTCVYKLGNKEMILLSRVIEKVKKYGVEKLNEYSCRSCTRIMKLPINIPYTYICARCEKEGNTKLLFTNIRTLDGKTPCPKCRKYYKDDEFSKDPKKQICNTCTDEYWSIRTICKDCGIPYVTKRSPGILICKVCWEKDKIKCVDCGTFKEEDKFTKDPKKKKCVSCNTKFWSIRKRCKDCKKIFKPIAMWHPRCPGCHEVEDEKFTEIDKCKICKCIIIRRMSDTWKVLCRSCWKEYKKLRYNNY